MPYHCDLIHAVSLPLGILSIGSYLQAKGHEVKLCDTAVAKENIEKVFDDFSPDIVGITFPSYKSIDGVKRISKLLRKKGVPIVWGGPFCDIADSQIMFNSGLVDIISFCEGEETWLDLVTTLENKGKLADIKGIAYLENGKAVYTPQREFLDLSVLPDIDYTLVDFKKYRQYLYGCKNLVYLYLSKGCPANCTFCINDLSHRNQYRRRPLEQFMREVKGLVDTYGIDGIYFCDELCFRTKAEMLEVCRAFDEADLGIKWGFQTRIGLLGEEEFRRVYDSGCRWIDFGVESGNREMLKKIKKNIPYDKIESTFEACSKVGIISLANFIVGFPGETVEQVKDTVALAMKIKSTQCTFMKYCFSPKTQLGKQVVASGSEYPIVKELADYKRLDFFRNRDINLSQVKTKELDVIQSHFLWSAIFRKDYGKDAKSFDLLLKSLWTATNRFAKMDFLCGIEACCDLLFLFIRFFCDEYFHPRIHKKYGLKKKQ